MSLRRVWKKLKRKFGNPALDIRPLPRKALREADAIITTNEVTDRHGTGVILNRIFGRSPRVLSIRSSTLYPEHGLGEAQLLFGHEGLRRSESYARVLAALNGSTVRRVLCVPFLADELITAIVLKELFDVPLAIFLMDDNNVHARGISDDLMREALGKASLRLAISPELRDAYEHKFGFKFWVVPPVVDEQSVQTAPQIPNGPLVESQTGVLIGSLWSREWLGLFRKTVKQSGLKVHWYGNARAPWLKTSPEELREDGIFDCGFLAETELTQKLKQYPFALVPTGTLDERDDRPEISRLSLPTRMPYLLAAANTPVIVLGHRNTAAARFVERFQVGKICAYEPADLREAVREISSPGQQMALRTSAAAHSTLFSARGLAEWIWKSLATGEPADDRFETAFQRRSGEVVTFIDPPVPQDLCGDFAHVYRALRRLLSHGFTPDFVIDVGASTGVWSDTAKRVFPRARYVLIDPLHAQYVRMNEWYYKRHPDFEPIAAAVSDTPGEAELNVSPDLYGSSLLSPGDSSPSERIKVPVRTLDEINQEKKLAGRGLLKVDVQFTEHLVLAGARRLLEQVDALLLELSLFRYSPEALLFPEMCELVRGLGFNYYEDIGGWRSPIDGTTLQKDVLFVRDRLFLQGGERVVALSPEAAVRDQIQTAKPRALAGASV